MRRASVLAVITLLAVTGCGRADATTGAAPARTTPAAAPATPTPATAATAVPLDHAYQQAAIHAAVLRHYLSGSDHSFGAGHRFPGVYVLNRLDPQAGKSMPGERPALTPIPATDLAYLEKAVTGVAPIRFVADRSEVVTTVDGCEQVRGDGILITLAPPKPAGKDRFEVGINGYVACLGATWLTYVVERGTGATWSVTGTVGGMAVA